MTPNVTTSPGPQEECPRLTAEVRRRLRHASVLLAAAELPADRDQQLVVLLRARGHLAGTIHKLEQLVADLRQVPEAFDDQLTERHMSDRIEPIP